MDLVDLMLLRIRKPPDDVVIRRLGWRVAARYFAWRNHLPLAEVIAALARRTGLPGDSPLPRTARAIGPALLRWGRPPVSLDRPSCRGRDQRHADGRTGARAGLAARAGAAAVRRPGA